MSHQKYYDYLQSLGHVLKLDENGNVDAFGHDFENHNGPSCINCGASWCHHCEEDAQVCEKELNSPPDVYDIVVDTGDGIYYTAEVVHFQQKGSKRMIQVRIGEPQSDDVRKDAERYRWLRHGDNDERVIQHGPVAPDYHWLPRNERLDEMIDNAITIDKARE